MLKSILAFFAILTGTGVGAIQQAHENYTSVGIIPQAHCVQFSVAAGTGCVWMCNYCANALGTFNYYFTDDVCTYQTGGCVGNPIAGETYTCCSAGAAA